MTTSDAAFDHALFDKAIEVTPQNREGLLKGTPVFFRLFANAAERLSYGSLILKLPDGRCLKFRATEAPEQQALISIQNFAMARRTLFGGTIGFYESYAADQWSSPDLAQALFVLAKNTDEVQKIMQAHFLLRTLNNFSHALNKNTIKGSQKNITAHYDLGNAFYEKWLDPGMTYSSALFAAPDQPLQSAQTAKYASLARQINLKPDERVLEIGSGWGGFAEYAAKEIGANVTGVTISPEQYDYACERMFREGLNDKVEIRLQDYRDINEQFDKIASIEMFEAVGREYWPAYFTKVRDSLKDDGLAGLQIITIADRFYPFYEKASDFIQRYVFPGGMLPSPEILRQNIEAAGLQLTDTLSFGQDYAKTLNSWHKNFLHAWDELTMMGFDDRFRKLWQFYLAYCEAGFRAESTDVCQVTLVRA